MFGERFCVVIVTVLSNMLCSVRVMYTQALVILRNLTFKFMRTHVLRCIRESLQSNNLLSVRINYTQPKQQFSGRHIAPFKPNIACTKSGSLLFSQFSGC
jgi:hypothetical protein